MYLGPPWYGYALNCRLVSWQYQEHVRYARKKQNLF